MIEVMELKEQAQRLAYENKRFLRLIGEEGYNVSSENLNDDGRFERNQLIGAAEYLEKAVDMIEYISKPIREEGYLTKNSDGRYELSSGYYFTSGNVCEVFGAIYETDEKEWHYTAIEHNGEDYYAVALGKKTSLEGLKVRIR